jgi:acyl-CoA synthetase (AMP-forming)/AMP-acid ligase II
MTLLDLLESGDARDVAITGVDDARSHARQDLRYSELRAHVASAAAALRAAGLGSRDVAAIVLPNGPALATAVLATAAAGISAPLNPDYGREEFAFYLDDLSARVLLVADGLDSPARQVAHERGIRTVEVGVPVSGPAGMFSLDGIVPAVGGTVSPGADDTALVLHTSGTTARPKMVPLTHANLCASANAIAETLRLGHADRCLNVMPLFHIHGIVAAVLASLASGGSVACAPGFLAPRFFPWLKACGPTWYTAVPTIHQAILARAGDDASRLAIRASRLRFVRSSSAALPRRVLHALEATFSVPVIEAYGMTEAAHQMTSNPLPPAERKPGSAGRAAGPEVAVVGFDGRPRTVGGPGEVVIRGPNVTSGYVSPSNPGVNANAFVDGWLRTGDEGSLDTDGYLWLTGRLKEQINRAGEKISPLEVDRVLGEHPAVASALSFSVEHPVLGEDIAAAVVLRQGAAVSERQLREYVAGRLAMFKVPRRIVIVDAIPTGATGKLQRIGLAARLDVVATVPVDDLDVTQPRSAVEQGIADAWAAVMGEPVPGVRRNFFALGGDSILAARLVAQIRIVLGVDVPLIAFFDTPSVEGLAAAVEELLAGGTSGAPGPSPRTARGPSELSSAQRSQWLFAELHAGTVVREVPKRLHLAGALDLDALHGALAEIVRRHEVLRTVITLLDGAPVQAVKPPGEISWLEIDARDWPEASRRAAVRARLDQEARRPFDLTRDLLVRPALARLDNEDYELQVTTHLVAFDGWSNGVFLRELGALYSAFAAGKASPLPELPLQYADFAAWERSQAASPRFAVDRDFWRAHVAGSTTAIDLSTGRTRAGLRGGALGVVATAVPPAIVQRLGDLALEEHATLFAVSFAAFQVLVSRRSGLDDFIVGAVSANRAQRETEDLIGSFQSVLPLRARLGGAPIFRAHLRRTVAFLTEAFSHQAFPYGQLETELQGSASGGRPPFQVVFNYRNMPVSLPVMSGITVSDFRAPHLSSSYDLLFNVTPRDGGLEISLDYDSDLFNAAMATEWLAGYRALVEGVANDPDGSTANLPVTRASGAPADKAAGLREEPIERAPRLPRPAPGT